MKKVKQFDIWLIDLNPTKWSEQKWIRPCLVVETNWTNNKGNTTIVIPITSNIDNIFSYDVLLSPNKSNWLQSKSKLKFRQVRVIDKSRLVKQIWIISDHNIIQSVLRSIGLIFDYEQMFNSDS